MLPRVDGDPGGQPDRDTGQSRVDAAGMQERPGDEGQCEVDPPAAEPGPLEERVRGDRGHRTDQRQDREVRREEHRERLPAGAGERAEPDRGMRDLVPELPVAGRYQSV